MIRPPMGAEKNRADLLPGTLDMLVLKILMSGHLHGYAIAQLIQQLSDDLLRVEEGSLYPALQRLELKAWITGEWGLSANNRRARFYKLTPDGRKQLAEESARYRRVTGVDLERGISKGVLERITLGPAFREHASLSNNGRYVAFASDQSGRLNIWMRDLQTGKESAVASSPFVQRYPVSNASGARIAFSVYEKDNRAVYVTARSGAPEKLCEGCLRATDWSRDEKTLLVFGGNPYQINVLDMASHQQTPLLMHPDYNLLYGRFSPDNRWVSFTARIPQNRGRIAIAPIDGPKPVPESAWITIADAGAEDWANWSPDGRTLYFTSWRDGNNCLWGQRIETSSRRLVGEAFAVQHLHGRVSYRQGGWSAAGGRIGLALVEATGNIWMMSRSGSPGNR
jgi:PadR family transcriptional regulator PadR